MPRDIGPPGIFDDGKIKDNASNHNTVKKTIFRINISHSNRIGRSNFCLHRLYNFEEYIGSTDNLICPQLFLLLIFISPPF